MLGAEAAGAGEVPNVNGAFFSFPAGGVDGGAPNEKGFAVEGLASELAAELGR